MFTRRPQISILVPFRDSGEGRAASWRWLHAFWQAHLPSTEIVVGNPPGSPFNKCVAVNAAARRARGRIFVILDADAYMNPAGIQGCADRIDAALKARRRLWLMPYDKLYRLNQPTSARIIKTNPAAPYRVSSPPPMSWLEDGYDQSGGHSQNYGHQYGAMAMVMPREAFFDVGGMDPRFRWGWGAEDASFLRALDTLYCQHEVAQADILHLWHVRPGTNWETRKWTGQSFTPANSRLARRYALATGEPGWMRGLINEHKSKSFWPWKR